MLYHDKLSTSLCMCIRGRKPLSSIVMRTGMQQSGMFCRLDTISLSRQLYVLIGKERYFMRRLPSNIHKEVE